MGGPTTAQGAEALVRAANVCMELGDIDKAMAYAFAGWQTGCKLWTVAANAQLTCHEGEARGTCRPSPPNPLTPS